MRRSVVLELVRSTIDSVLDAVPLFADEGSHHARRVDWSTRENLRGPQDGETTLVVCADGFEPEGDDCDALVLVEAYKAGWKRFIVYGLKGQRFHGCGFGPDTGRLHQPANNFDSGDP